MATRIISKVAPDEPNALQVGDVLKYEDNYVMYTSNGKLPNSFEGVVLHADPETPQYSVGHFEDAWCLHSFKKSPVTISFY